VENAAELKKVAQAKIGKETPEEKRARIKAMLEAARNTPKDPPTLWERIEEGPVGWVFGYKVRFVLGVLLLAGFAVWIKQNGLIPGREALEVVKTTTQPIGPRGSEGPGTTDAAKQFAGSWMEKYREAKPLKAPVVGGLFTNVNALIAGLLLFFASFIPGLRIALVIFPAALILLFASGWIGLAIGAGLGGIGLLFVR
jgi:hypothetical protein